MSIDSLWLIAQLFVKTCLYATTFFSIGSLSFQLIFKPKHSFEDNRLNINIIISAILAAFLTLLFLSLQTGYLLEDGLMGMIDFEVMQFFLEGTLKYALMLKLAGLILVVIAIKTKLKALAFGGILLVIFAFMFQGHIQGSNQLLSQISLFIHIGFIALWFGALLPLYKMQDHEQPHQLAENFGKLAAIFVPILLLMGGFLAWQNLNTFDALFSTLYGRSLLIKIGFVTLLLSLAAINKLRLAPALKQGTKAAIDKLHLSIKFEAFAFFIIFTITAYLTTVVGV